MKVLVYSLLYSPKMHKNAGMSVFIYCAAKYKAQCKTYIIFLLFLLVAKIFLASGILGTWNASIGCL
jgi:hypothetical protein